MRSPGSRLPIAAGVAGPERPAESETPRRAAILVEARKPAAVSLREQAPVIARACRAMAARFRRGGKLIAFGDGAASTDAQHVTVEFLHPVIVGKRALPAVCLTNDAATLTGDAERSGWREAFAHSLEQLASADDIAIGISSGAEPDNVRRAFDVARKRGLLTVSLAAPGTVSPPRTDFRIAVAAASPLAIREAHVTAYHVLWELVHVFLELPPAAVEAE